ncbi:uncharacterized protein LOC131150764 isoform X2 [Malania oleifera]|uniref:uncharacterized protein LOC131150764 isoform X2 n=1 Tax=Malania oleifera TaxID=397392 RepID=UPI0025ADDE06|nr:uncharacterized protein LOC131150764 isoform X2 [Malania oleifera]
MDCQDQKKMMSSSGHDGHGVHLCHKCGWPFPNPHPSAKHRRAHKRICGTIEGYALIQSEETARLPASDDGRLSDEDQRTPSPKILARSNNDNGSGGIGERSNRSEDEVFSDAVMEFSDPGFSPRSEGPLEDARISFTKAEKIVEDATGAFNGTATADLDIIQPPKDPTASSDGCDVQNCEALESAPVATLPRVHNSSSMVNSIVSSNSEFRSEDLAFGLQSDGKGPGPEVCNDTSKGNINANSGDNVMQYSTACIEMENDAKEIMENYVDSTSAEIAISPSKTVCDSSEGCHNLLEMDRKFSDPMFSGIVDLKEVHSDGLIPNIAPDDHVEAESSHHTDAIIMDTATTVNSAQELSVLSCDLVEGSNMEGGGSAVAHLSVSDDIHVKEHPAIMLEDFRGHKLMKSDLLTPDFGETVRVEDGIKAAVSEENLFSFQSSDFGGNKDKGSKLVVEEASVKREADDSELKVVSRQKPRSNDGDASEGDARSETEMKMDHRVCSCEEREPHDLLSNSAREILPTKTTITAGLNPLVSPVDAEARQMTKSTASDCAGNNANYLIGICDTVGNDGKEVAKGEDFIANTETPPEFACTLSENDVHCFTSLLGVDDTDDHTIKDEKSDFAGDESGIGAIEGHRKMNSTMAPECASCSAEPQRMDDGRDGSVNLKKETESIYVDRVCDSSRVGNDMTDMTYMSKSHSDLQKLGDEEIHEGINDLQINGNKKVQEDCVGVVGETAKSNENGDISQTCEPMISPATDKSFVQCLSGSGGREFDTSTSAMISESLLEEDDCYPNKHQLSILAIENLVNLSSQTDSLEGDWGSVSVSTQSDTPAVDAEALPSNDSQNSAQGEKANLMKLTVSEGHNCEKSDNFEPPSFMTLVESTAVAEEKSASNTQTAEIFQQAEPASLQAAWFPSVSNVVNESPGRKKNEEIIAKVTNWNTAKQHTPLKSLLGEANIETKAKLPNPKENPIPVSREDEALAKDDGAVSTAVNLILGHKAATAQDAKIETAKEWNSPARYPTEIKREKRKLKGKPYWAQFVCCSSVN